MSAELLVRWVSSVCGPIGSCRGWPTCSPSSLLVSGWAFHPALLGPELRGRTEQTLPKEAALLLFFPQVALTPTNATAVAESLQGEVIILCILEG